MAQWIACKGEKVQADAVHRQERRPQGVESSDESGNDEEECIVPKPNKKLQQRTSVSAEAFGIWNKKEDFKPKVVKKNHEQVNRITERLASAFMFQALDDKEKEVVVGAMEEVKFKYVFLI